MHFVLDISRVACIPGLRHIVWVSMSNLSVIVPAASAALVWFQIHLILLRPRAIFAFNLRHH